MTEETESQRYVKFVKWLWLKRTVQKDFHVNVLTESNAKVDSSLPSPPLTQLESEDLFRYLEGHKLVFHKGEVFGNPVYSLNKAEPFRWQEVIDELEKPEWKRAFWYQTLKKGFVYVTSLLVAAFIGAYTGYLVEKLVKRGDGPSSSQDSKNSSTNNSVDTQNGKN